MTVWKSDLWNPLAGNNVVNCLFGWFSPCGLHGSTTSKVDSTSSCVKSSCVYLLLQLCCLQGIAGVKLRRQMRNDFGLDGNDLNACASYTICSCLSVIQDANEYQMQADASLRAAPGQQAMTK